MFVEINKVFGKTSYASTKIYTTSCIIRQEILPFLILFGFPLPNPNLTPQIFKFLLLFIFEERAACLEVAVGQGRAFPVPICETPNRITSRCGGIYFIVQGNISFVFEILDFREKQVFCIGELNQSL